MTQVCAANELIKENDRLREGIEQALKHMKAGRRTVAISTLKAVLSGETW